MEPRTDAGRRLVFALREDKDPGVREAGRIVERLLPAIEEEARTVNPEGRSTDEDGLRAAIRAAFDATSVNADGIDWGCAGDLDGLATRLASALTTSSPGDELGADRLAPLTESQLTKAIGAVARVAGGELLAGGPRHWVGLSSAILEELARSTPSSSPRTPTDG